jgi:hypothetical protein
MAKGKERVGCIENMAVNRALTILIMFYLN